MKKMMAALAIGLMMGGVAMAGDQDFTLSNKTGVEIAELYVSPASLDNWGEDVLGVDVLADGGDVNITFSPEEEADFWDLKVVDGEGASIVWTHLKLTEISKVTLKIDGDKPVAECE